MTTYEIIALIVALAFYGVSYCLGYSSAILKTKPSPPPQNVTECGCCIRPLDECENKNN
jgi:hypothetical protein